MTSSQPDLLHRPGMLYILYGMLCLAVGMLVVPTWGWTYWDFGDGNYLYIARRVREGLVLYKDILAPQPPLHTFSGMVAQWIGETIFGSALLGSRAFSLLVRFAQGFMILLLARRFFGCPLRALVAAGVYLFLPIGFWWSMGYQSENLEIVFLLGAIYLLTFWDPKRAAIAGVLSALACHCNMTGVPFLLANALFLAFRRPGLLPWYLASAATVYFAIAIGVNIWTEGYFITNVLLNQAGTFPPSEILAAHTPGDNFWKYAWRKITGEGAKVLELQGALIMAAMVGVLMILRATPRATGTGPDRDRWHTTEFLSWQFIAGLLSICFTAKGGTVNYIFVLGEPMIAVCAAEAIVQLFRRFLPAAEEWRGLSIWNTRAFLLALFPVLILGIAYHPAIRNIRFTLTEIQVELPSNRVQELQGFIRTYAEPGDLILAPPFYAFATDTIVAGELAENYIWNVKYNHELFYGQPDEGVEKMEEVAELLRRQEVKVVLLDLAQTGRVLPIQEAIAEFYQPAEPRPYRTRNTNLGLYIPIDTPLKHVPLFPDE